ncbi:MAG: NIPSNAP family protein [Caldilineaceae bacterium]|nr:NIPSNAP family protein [Caldilineaceae bacterium]HRJ41923.1 NIPSNAP family protein [Caldilineaceae bacterium]
MLYELRIYECHPGQRDAWVQYMEEEIIPFQVAKGMVIVGSFVDEQDPNRYVWMRRFVDEAERVRLYEAVYQSDHWKNTLAPRNPSMINRETIQVMRLNPTAKSVLQ